jgi:CBS domain-containing protein
MTIATVLLNKGRDVATIRPDATLREAAAALAGKKIGALVVLGESGEIAGVLSERDIVTCLAAHGDSQLLDRPVSQAMTAPAITVRSSDPVLNALALMTARRIRHLPVLQDGALVGLVSIGDLVKYRIENIEREAEAMRSYIQGA